MTRRSEVVSNLFPDFLRNAIVSIPLGNTSLADKWVWRPSKSGKFTVKAAYSFILEASRELDEPAHPTAASARTWKLLWKLRVPPRIVHFIWRCIYGALPFADTLARRGVLIDNSCPFCKDGPSTATHLFFDCSFAADIWRQADMHAFIAAISAPTSQQRFCDVLEFHDLNVDLFCIICYMIWFYRNRTVFEGIKIDDKLVFRASATLLSDYTNSNSWPERFPISLSCKVWTKPPAKGLRIFFDGAISRRPGGGTGVFVSDETGRFIHGACKFYPGIDNPFLIELLALRDALRLASHLHLHSFSVLGDSQNAILAANGEMDVPIFCASVLEDINNSLQHLAFLGLHWIRRGKNLMAHELAFFAKTHVDCNESWSFIPEVFLSISTG